MARCPINGYSSTSFRGPGDDKNDKPVEWGADPSARGSQALERAELREDGQP